MTDAMISLQGVTKTFPGTTSPAVGDLSFDVPEGAITVLVGPSGCGKTTTLKMINRLVEPTSGTIEVAGRDVTSLEAHELRRGIGYVIQQIGLFPHRTIADNIATVPRMLGWDKARIADRIDELVGLVDLEPEMRDRYPAELSGGQRQRAGVARALAADPPVLLMDEPFGAVDPIVRARLQDELLSLQERLHKTIVLVTHDIDEAIKVGDLVAILKIGGKLEQYDDPAEVLRNPANEFVADFLGEDRGIKRLSLIPIRTVDLERGPVVAPDSGMGEAKAVMARYEIDWIAVGERDRIDGWVSASDLDGGRIGDAPIRPFRTTLTPNSSLRDALDAVLSSHTKAAAVFDGDRYLGMLSLDRITEKIVN
ncbi:MAG: ATP-binding cassette domain-containing protein [Acidimicrobiia bacterium]|nr:ATP-binding cassette domain-containing protein [Acidimicrobiia bacterium]MDH3470458.1 ATP-binding cassette domain-containing protein [Acidimicrobiia bacterium]